MTYGYLGMDVFLVIAGYLTTRSFYKKMIVPKESDGGDILLKFECERIIRLLPPLLVAGTFCMALDYFFMLPDDYENVSESVIATNSPVMSEVNRLDKNGNYSFCYNCFVCERFY